MGDMLSGRSDAILWPVPHHLIEVFLQRANIRYIHLRGFRKDGRCCGHTSLMIAVVLLNEGNVTTKEVVLVLSPPKNKTATALLLLVELYINAPLAVIAPVNVTVLNEVNAVLPEEVGAIEVRTAPPAVYPEATTSPEVV
jgi:hypothetical protein